MTENIVVQICPILPDLLGKEKSTGKEKVAEGGAPVDPGQLHPGLTTFPEMMPNTRFPVVLTIYDVDFLLLKS